ncbi:MAG TPA: type II toxin-antitoxin system PemK/MazF family toxin [Firmicutes bacterium]|nr:type II toxin-antitoxin system PemK/MazF family toxin [Bacillota bacterium]
MVLDQIRAIDKTRLRQRIGELSWEEISEVKSIIKEMLVD